MNMNLNAHLAVLSACETANGKISPGEGVMGTSWAFFVAGTRSLLVSQWKVNSASTSRLMTNFYRALGSKEKNQGGEKARSLQEALSLPPRHSNPIERFLMGSVSAAVAARAHCSVEVVRARARTNALL
jgi:CHAT domain